MPIEKATLGGGCFWCLDAVYRKLDGVVSSTAGYAGGHKPDPSYREVCSGTTGHAEVVQVEHDTDKMSYREILEVFYTIHDPTTKDRQGADIGSQYRSIILTHDEGQAEVARRLIAELTEERVFSKPIVTEIEPLERFWRAEEYHQDYYANHPGEGYCAAVIAPKLAKFRKRWAERLKA